MPLPYLMLVISRHLRRVFQGIDGSWESSDQVDNAQTGERP